jgi:hypothetical protein
VKAEQTFSQDDLELAYRAQSSLLLERVRRHGYINLESFLNLLRVLILFKGAL